MQTEEADNNRLGADTSVDVIRLAAIYRELYLYDACGFVKEGSWERLKLRSLVVVCALPSDVKDEVVRFMDAPDNQHYGDHDQSVCSEEPAVARMVSLGAAASKQTRLAILSRAAMCTSAREDKVFGEGKGNPVLYNDYWQALNSINKVGVKPGQEAK